MNYSDFASSEFFKDPYPTYEELRNDGKLVTVAPKVVFAGHYETVAALLNEKKLGKSFLEGVAMRYGSQATSQPVFKSMNRMFIMMNPPSHTRLRGLLANAFSSKSLSEFRVVANNVAHNLIDKIEGKSEVDLVREFARPLPIQVICRLLDIPVEDGLRLGEETALAAKLLDAVPVNDELLASANRASLELQSYFTDVVAKRARRPGRDLITALIDAEFDRHSLTTEEIVSNVMMLFLAGHETTSNMIGNAIVTLHNNPDQLQRLRENLSLLPNAITECIRFDSSVQMTARSTLDDVVIDGTTIAKGTLIYLILGSANRDPEKYTKPDVFDIDRDLNGKTSSFGGGIHYCLGARLAIIELEAAIGSLIQRLPLMRIKYLSDLHWLAQSNLRGLRELFVETATSKSLWR